MTKIQSSAGTLSFVGDAYFGLLVRGRLAEIERPLGELHRLSVTVVNASAQALGFAAVEPLLSEEEKAVFKRGRNLHTNNTPKNSTVAEYHTATGLECLFGYLYLSKNTERAEQLFDIIFKTVYKTS